MFGGTLWGGSIGGLDDHTQKERDPPARPIDLEFPTYVPPLQQEPLNLPVSSSIRDRICHIRSFNDISEEDLKRFNIDYHQNVSASDMLPSDLFVDRPLLFDEDLDAMLAEISVDNRDAFREILRMDPLPGRTKPRLAYARNFFGSLEDMARYWDNSLDEYYLVPVDNNAARKSSSSVVAPRIKGPTELRNENKSDQSIESSKDTEMKDVNADAGVIGDIHDTKPNTKEVYKGYRFGNGEQLNPGTRVAMVKNLLKMVMHKFGCRDHEPIPAPREKFVFRGVKIQSVQYQFCVARIPKDTKLARARMVEGPLLAAQCREEVHFKQNPRLAPPDAVLTKSATDGSVSPLGAAPTSPRLVPGKGGPVGPSFVGEKFDLFREIGSMLILAAQRIREGKSKDSYSGADKWWVKEQRWGGGSVPWGNLAIEIFEEDDPSWSPEERRLQEEKRLQALEAKNNPSDSITARSAIAVDDLLASNAPTVRSIPGEPLTGPIKKKLRSLDRPPGKEEEFRDGKRLTYVPPFKKKWYHDWQKLRPNTPMWDDKIIYKQIGKQASSEFDDIFSITSANHHVALLRMRVHPDYLAWVENGTEVTSDEVEPGHSRNILYVQRSVWFDMFNVNARREFLITLWRLMCWLNRDHIDQAEYEKMEAKKQAVKSA